MKHRNIPVFVTHQGCPNKCVFCDQKKITGTTDMTPLSAHLMLEKAFEKDSAKESEIAFFGGSFTAIERKRMIGYLEAALPFVESGKASGIRLSTRPDALDPEILDILKYYHVKNIEIGVQSLSDKVLLFNKRGHDAKTAVESMKRVKAAGFRLTGQMMTGLYQSTFEDEMMTARGIIECGADETRIYPTAVFSGTELASLFLSGKYSPPGIGESIDRASKIAELFIENNVDILRIGLCAADSVSSDKPIAGAFHEAFGEMVYSRIYFDRICEKLSSGARQLPEKIRIYAAKGEISKAVGQKKENKIKLSSAFGKSIVFAEDENLKKYEVRIEKCI